MWNLQFSSKVIDGFNKRNAHEKHRLRMRNMKPQVNTISPHHYSFLTSKSKTKQLEFQKKRTIDAQNSRLVHQMFTCATSIPSKHEPYYIGSLNAGIQQKRLKEIDDSNLRLVQRLQKTTSLYSQKNMSKSVKKYKKIRTNITRSQMDPFYDLPADIKKQKKKDSVRRYRPLSAKG